MSAKAKVLVLVMLAAMIALPAAAATNPEIVAGTASGQAGASVALPVMFTAGTTGVGSLQFDLILPSSITYAGSSTAGSAATGANKSVDAATISGGVRVLIGGLNQSVIPSGDLVSILLNLPSGISPGQYTITPSNVVLSDVNANAVSSTVAGGSVTVTGTAASTSTTSSTPTVVATPPPAAPYVPPAPVASAPSPTTIATSSNKIATSTMMATSTIAVTTTSITMATSTASSTVTSQVTVAALTAQLTTLEQQLVTLEFGHYGCPASFSENLTPGMSGAAVLNLQKVLNYTFATQVAQNGPGSPGNESTYFGPATEAAVINFQNIFSAQILAPEGLSAGTGTVGPATRAELNLLCR